MVPLTPFHVAGASLLYLPLLPLPPASWQLPCTRRTGLHTCRPAGPGGGCGLVHGACAVPPVWKAAPQLQPLSLSQCQSLLLPRAAPLGCVLPPSVRGLQRLHGDPRKVSDSPRTLEKQPGVRLSLSDIKLGCTAPKQTGTGTRARGAAPGAPSLSCYCPTREARTRVKPVLGAPVNRRSYTYTVCVI